MPYANMLSLIKSYSYIYICMFVIYFYHDYDYDYLSRGVKECLILSFFPVGSQGFFTNFEIRGVGSYLKFKFK